MTLRSLIKKTLWLALCSLWCIAALPDDASARLVSQPSDKCTNGPQFNTDLPPGTPGLFSTLASFVNTTLSGASKRMYEDIVNDTEFKAVIGAMVTLYVGIYGILFAFGMARTSAYNFTKRLVKIAFLALLISPTSWTFFNNHVVQGFNGTMNVLVNSIRYITVGGAPVGGNIPLAGLDQLLADVVSANMFVHLLATIFTSPYGFFHAILLGLTVWFLFGLMITAIWVYLISMVLRALLFATAPFFIACLLFRPTHPFFIGWLNQLLNSVLQPIMLFSFFAFYLAMIQGPIDQILDHPVCWTPADDALRGTPFHIDMWRYMVPDSNTATNWSEYNGKWDMNGATGAPGAGIFPLNTVQLLVLLLLADLGRRFSQVVLMLARNLAASSLNLSGMTTSIGSMIPSLGRPVGDTPAGDSGSGSGAAAARTAAAGTTGTRRGPTGSSPDTAAAADGAAAGTPSGQKKPLSVTEQFRTRFGEKLEELIKRKE